jgi:hypothetical protein
VASRNNSPCIFKKNRTKRSRLIGSGGRLNRRPLSFQD